MPRIAVRADQPLRGGPLAQRNHSGFIPERDVYRLDGPDRVRFTRPMETTGQRVQAVLRFVDAVAPKQKAA